MANDEVTVEDRARLDKVGAKYGDVGRAWRVTADGKPAVLGVCSYVAIVLTDDDSVRLAYKKAGTRVAASGATRTLEASTTSTAIDFGDTAAASAFDAEWPEPGVGTPAPLSSRGWLQFLSSLLIFLAVVVLVGGVIDAVVLFAHSRQGTVSDGYGGTEVGRVHPQVAAGFAVLLGSVVSAAVLAWCGVAGQFLLENLGGGSSGAERQTPSLRKAPSGEAT